VPDGLAVPAEPCLLLGDVLEVVGRVLAVE
jgi:hypothetical protein